MVAVICAVAKGASRPKSRPVSRASSQPVSAPPARMTGKRQSAWTRSGSGTPRITKPMKMPKSAMAAASLSRLSPSTMRARRWGAAMERKIDTTAEGSVVEMIAPRSRQAISGSPADQCSA